MEKVAYGIPISDYTWLGMLGSSPWAERLTVGLCNFISRAVRPNGPLTEDIPLEGVWIVKEIKKLPHMVSIGGPVNRR